MKSGNSLNTGLSLRIVMSSKIEGISIRKVSTAGNSLTVTLPKEWTEIHGVKKGDSLEIIFDDMLYIRPIETAKLSERLERAKAILEGE
jgi:antitoxin component of MazEF toxin-antitoxin module